ELDWAESTEVAGVRLTAAPAWHFSGRGLRRNPTLWASWVIAGQRGRVFYSGDSGYFDGYREIGAAHGPFDASLIQVGACDASWPDIHMTPEEGVRAQQDLRGGLLIPVHWGTFTLAPHPWAEPADRVVAAAGDAGVPIVVPNPGPRIAGPHPPAQTARWKAHRASVSSASLPGAGGRGSGDGFAQAWHGPPRYRRRARACLARAVVAPATGSRLPGTGRP